MNNKALYKGIKIFALFYVSLFALASVMLLSVGIWSFVTSKTLDSLSWPAIILGGLATSASYFMVRFFWNNLKYISKS